MQNWNNKQTKNNSKQNKNKTKNMVDQNSEGCAPIALPPCYEWSLGNSTCVPLYIATNFTLYYVELVIGVMSIFRGAEGLADEQIKYI